MTQWFTADFHLGHRNIIEYCNRPFTDVDEMNRALIANWNQVVGADDTVWVVGDFALGKIAETLPLASALNGRKILIAGNHDRCWSGHGRRADGWTERYSDAGFDEVIQGSAHAVLDRRRVLLCHFPYRGDSQNQDRFVDARPVDKGEWLLHGHVHDRWSQRGRMINVGVDTNDFTPVSETALARRVTGGPINA
jgi:calcineurin-like phosphoesterase family protein